VLIDSGRLNCPKVGCIAIDSGIDDVIDGFSGKLSNSSVF
jgi:hypothetical protein